MVNAGITEQSVLRNLENGDYGMALSAAFSLLDGALGNTSGTNARAMKDAIKKHLTVFVRAMMGFTAKEMPGGIGSFKMMYNDRLTDLPEILYDIRCNIQHEAKVDVVSLTEREINLDPVNRTVKLPLSIILGLLGVAKAIRQERQGP